MLPCVSQCSLAKDVKSENASPQAWDSAIVAELSPGDARIALAMQVGGPLL